MNKWTIKFDTKAEKLFYKLPINIQESVLDYLYNRILTLEHPKLSGKALSANKKGYWRYRVDKFRIICKLKEEVLIILIVKIAKRDVVYDD
jgi:mRNA interferase RelE/StbE